MAKELSMLARNEMEKETMNYSIECEKNAKEEIKQFTLKESLLAQIKLIEENEALQIENNGLIESAKVNTPKVDFFDAVVDSKTAVEMSKVAKSLAIKGYGRNNMTYIRKAIEHDRLKHIEKIPNLSKGKII